MENQRHVHKGHLDVKNVGIYGAERLATLLRSTTTTVTSLSLYLHDGLTRQDTAMILGSIQSNSSLVSLELHNFGSNEGTDFVLNLFRNLRFLTTLKTLSLQDTVDIPVCKAVRDLLQVSTSLIHLKIDSILFQPNDCADACWCELLSGVEKNGRLQTLEVGVSYLPAMAASRLADLLRSSTTALKTVKLGLMGDHSHIVWNGLRMNPNSSIESLSLFLEVSTLLARETATALGSAIRGMKRLHSLDVQFYTTATSMQGDGGDQDDPEILDAVGDQMLQCVANQETLTRVEWGGNCISDSFLKKLTMPSSSLSSSSSSSQCCLHGATRLQSLVLSAVHLGAEGILHLAHFVRGQQQEDCLLSEMVLKDWCSCTNSIEKAVVVLIRALAVNRSLKRFSLLEGEFPLVQSLARHICTAFTDTLADMSTHLEGLQIHLTDGCESLFPRFIQELHKNRSLREVQITGCTELDNEIQTHLTYVGIRNRVCPMLGSSSMSLALLPELLHAIERLGHHSFQNDDQNEMVAGVSMAFYVLNQCFH